MSGLFETITGLALLDPWLLLLILLVPAMLWFRRRRGSPAVLFAPGEFLDKDPDQEMAPLKSFRSWRSRLHRLPRALQVAALLLVILALARPVRREPIPLETEGIDILLCLDISSSMTRNDLDPQKSRLDLARSAAARFIAGRPNDRVGLISFARYPDILCPLTLDHDALDTLLSRVTTVENDGPEDATGIGTAVALAARILSRSESDSRVVILLTDGEENVATTLTPDEIAPIHAAQLCEEFGIRVYSIAAGVGNPDQSGGWIPLDTSQIENLSEKTGGRFFTARDAGAVAKVYDNIDALEKVELQVSRYKVEERFLPFLIAAIALMLAGRFLRSSFLEVLP